jgi:glycosyltransferase involved in cell wall biosynthesis
MFSIIILTYNEESSLQLCFDHIKFCDDIVVIDSCSNDSTVEIAEKNGARVFTNRFKNFGDQRNFAIDKVEYKYDWVFHLDVDEHFTEDLRNECEASLKDYKFGAFMVPSKMILYGKWLKNSGDYPVYQMRFHKIGDARFIKWGHGQRESDLKNGLGSFKSPYLHNSFDKGISSWLLKHIKYAEEEAKLFKKERKKFNILNLFSRSKLVRYREVKNLGSTLPMKPLLRFLYYYLYKKGFMDGRVGLEYCKMQFLFQLMISMKVFEGANDKKP